MKIRLVIETHFGRAGRTWRKAGRAALVLVVTWLGAVTLTAQTNVVSFGNVKAHPTRILAKYKQQVVLEASAEILRQAGSRIERRYRQLPQLVVLETTDGAAGDSEPTRRTRLISRINDLKRTGLFEYVEPDFMLQADLVPTDQAFVDGSLWGLRNQGQNNGVVGADIAAPAAWDVTTGSTNVIVAVIDTGIRSSHRDLTNQMWRNPGESGGGKENNGKDDDGDGYIDNVYGINAITGSGNPFDDNGHGTHVSGTIGAAANDGNPHVGVTWRVRLMGCKFLSAQGSGFTSDAIECVDFAVSKGARILNNSWGGGGFSQALYDSIDKARAKGVLFVAAAGNNGTDNDQLPFYPSNYNLDNVIAVAALTRRDRLASFSNFGHNKVNLGAPGQDIYSCWSTSDTAYNTIDGTSMASPHVSGVAALILSRFPAADLAELRDRIFLGTVPIPALAGLSTTGGRLNAYNSLTISGSGILQVSVNPPSGSTLLASSSQPIYVTVTDLFGVTDATVTATISSGGSLTFVNNGLPPDAVANNGVYSALFSVPAATNPVTLTVTVSAPGKIGSTSLVTYTVVPPPPNDYFTNATKVPSGGGLYLANNRFATLEPGEPQHAAVTNLAGSLWWAWTPVSSTNVFIDTTGSGIDTVLAVYTGNTLGSLVRVVATNDVGLKKQGYVSFNAQGGTAYRIAVASAGTNSMGSLQMRVTPGGQLDTTLPLVVVNTPLSGVTVTTNLILVAGTAVDPAPNVTGISEVLLSINGAIVNTAAGTTNWSAPALLQPGFNTIVVTAVDAAGNASHPVTVQVNYFPNDPANDFFVNAIALTAVPEVSFATNVNATKEFNEPNHAGNSGGKSVWWWFQPPADGALTLSTTNSTFDTLLGVYTGNAVDSLTTIASNEDAYDGAPGGFSRLTVAVRSNQVYRIAVDGYDGVAGNVVLRYSFVPATLYRLTINSTTGGTTDPTSVDVPGGGTVSVTAFASAGYLFEMWDGDLVSFANPVSVLVNGDRTLTAHFRAVAYVDGFESGNLTGLGWTTGGDVPWLVQTNTTGAGGFAARSGVIGDNQSSSLFLGGDYHAGVGSFDVRVSSEAEWDFLRFYLDGVLQQQWSGEFGWANHIFPITAGAHILGWRYSKDANNSNGLDAAFIDNVNLPVVVPINGTTPAHLVVRRASDGTIFIDLTGQPGQRYLLQASSDLVTWQTISTNVALDGSVRVIDAASLSNLTRFYRAVVTVP